MATEAGNLSLAVAGTNAANLAGAILVAAKTNGFTSRWGELAGIANRSRIGRFRMFGGIAMAGIAALFCIGVMVTSEGLDYVFVASGARFPFSILRTGSVRDEQHRN